MSEIKFGVFLPFYAFGVGSGRLQLSFNHLQKIVRECDVLGYHSVWLDDHLMFRNMPILECWTTLSALSSVTKRIRLGTMVLCNSFRNPSLLAKMATTFDIISNGRLEFGIGAGVQRNEHIAYGLPFSKSHVRIGRMKESVEIIKKMWTEEKTSYEGKYYKTKEAICEPKPLQKPHPPITIGGVGEKLTLRVTAQHANRYDWGYLPSLRIYKDKLQVLEKHCSSVGRDIQKIERSCWPGEQILISSDQKELEKEITKLKPKSVSLEEFKKRNIVGTPEDCILKIQQYVNLKVTHFMLFFGDLPNLRSLQLFAEKVVSKIKKI